MLEFRAQPEAHFTILRRGACLETNGLGGRLYWCSLWRIHEVMFLGMLRRITGVALHEARTAEQRGHPSVGRPRGGGCNFPIVHSRRHPFAEIGGFERSVLNCRN
jgi:hypothetical protein